MVAPVLPDQFSNFASTSLAGGGSGAGGALVATDTTLIVTSTTGAAFPATQHGPFMVLLGSVSGPYELVLCTARTSDTLTLVRAQEGTAAQAWALGTNVAQAETAGNLTHLWAASPMVFNVKALPYGAVGDGVTNDTTAIQAAINAAQAAGGGVVYFPEGVYYLSAALTISASGLTLAGAGWGGGSGGGGGSDTGTILSLANGVNDYLIKFTPPNSVRLDGIVVRDMKLACNAANQTATSGGINVNGAAYGLFERLWVEAPYQDGITLQNDNLGGFGHHHVVRACWFHDGVTSPLAGGGRGVALLSADECRIVDCVFERCGTPAGTYNGAALYDASGLNVVEGCIFVADPTTLDVNQAKHVSGNGSAFVGCVFDGGTFGQLALTSTSVTAACTVTGCRFYEPINGAQSIYIAGPGHTITGNIFLSSPTAHASNTAVDGSGVAAGSPSVIANNTFITQGAWASGTPVLAASRHIVRDNVGYSDTSVYDVRAYGATGDGVTDDTAAVQAAINMCGIQSPTAPTATGNTGTGSTFTAAQTVLVGVTFVNAAGETTLNATTTVTIAASGDDVVVTLPTFPVGVTGANVYASTASGSATLYRVTSGSAPTSVTSGGTVTLTGFAPNTNASPPTSNTTGSGAGRVTFPAGTYLVSSTLYVNSDNVTLAGVGWGAQLLAAAGFAPSGSALLMVQNNGIASGAFRYGIVIEDLCLNGANVAGVGGVQLTSTYHAYLRHLRVEYCPGTGIFFTGSSAQRGAYTTCVDCVVTNGGAGVAYLTNYAENNTIIGGLVAWYNTSGGIGAKLQDGVNQLIGVVFDECDTAINFYFSTANQVIGCQFTRGVTHFLYFQGASYSVVAGCYFDSFVGTASGQHMIDATSGCVGNHVDNCTVNSGTGWPGFLNDNSNAGALNVYSNCQTQGLQVLTNASQAILRNCAGFNPRGASMTQPAVPASGTALSNTYDVDATVYVSGGTVSAIAIGGTATGLTSGAFRLVVGQSVTLTYTVAPSWSWLGD